MKRFLPVYPPEWSIFQMLMSAEDCEYTKRAGRPKARNSTPSPAHPGRGASVMQLIPGNELSPATSLALQTLPETRSHRWMGMAPPPSAGR
jgi:hypothetical protein